MSMNTTKILELLGTTSPQKMASLERMESFPRSSEESANEMLNAELFGSVKTQKPRARSASESVRNVRLGTPRKPVSRAAEGMDKPADANIEDKNKGVAKEVETPMARDSKEDEIKMVMNDILNEDEAVVAHFDYWPQDFTEEKKAELAKKIEEMGYHIVAVNDADTAEESVATEGCGRRKKAEEASTERKDQEWVDYDLKHRGKVSQLTKDDIAKTGYKFDKWNNQVEKEGEAKEMLVETSEEAKFPEEFDFDEAKFAEDYGIDAKTIKCIYVEEDPQAKVAEHIEVSFEHDDAAVTLHIYADGRVEETVDAEVIDPQFTAEFVKEEDDDGNVVDVLALSLIEEDDEDVLKSEGDETTKSEGDEKHKDEAGKDTTDEFVEEAGLNLDPFYSDTHHMKLADKGAGKAPAGMAGESIAAKLIRTSK